jgi:(4-(4-[2-(gamma-L-glutamylamino)ethyl]phenoxymethyl)furan-2-yl)methanamine synthase
MPLLAFDIGGANLKVADGKRFCLTHPFPLWRQPEGLADAVATLAAQAPPAERWVATMTGELADCFATKADGVAAIVGALRSAADGRDVFVYLTDGRFVPPAEALEKPLRAAATNWHALACFAARLVEGECGLLLDIGSTTTDIIPIADGRPVAAGETDPERLISGELVYTGVQRTPVCALAAELPWAGRVCPTAAEVFATAWDVYLTLGDLPEEPESLHTADGRPATQSAARDRLARQICADRTLFSQLDALAAARSVAAKQQAQIVRAGGAVLGRLPRSPETVILSGQGEFLARRVVEAWGMPAKVVSLAQLLGPVASTAATAYALATLAREELAREECGAAAIVDGDSSQGRSARRKVTLP